MSHVARQLNIDDKDDDSRVQFVEQEVKFKMFHKHFRDQESTCRLTQKSNDRTVDFKHQTGQVGRKVLYNTAWIRRN